MGLKANYRISSDSYSIFTTNSQSDPFMWVYYGGTQDCKMYMFNNDYEPTGNFDWGKNARISKLSSPVIERVLISSAGSYDPIGKCELYIGCKEFRENNSTNPFFNTSSFPNMKTDDTMVSAPADSTYNCFAWAGGVHSEVFWPIYISSPYYSDQIVVERTPLDALDQYYASERYPGGTRYVRTSSTTENVTGGIDVWATNSGTITHASINQNSDANYHGYAWESKLGSEERIFHVRDALINRTYGKIAYHYEPINDGTTTVSLEEAIANETAVMDNPILTDAQEYFISSGIASMATADKVKFNTLYNKWQYVWNHSITGNPEIIKDDSAYSTLLESCMANPEYMLFIYDKVNRGVASVIPLFESLAFTDNQKNMARIKDIRDAREQPEYDTCGRKIIRTAASNLKRLLKQIIPDTGSAENENIMANRESQFDLGLTGNRISATIALARPTDVSIDILDLECRRVCVIKEGGTIDTGNHRFSSQPLDPGTYLVRCMLNGCLNVKKIIIK